VAAVVAAAPPTASWARFLPKIAAVLLVITVDVFRLASTVLRAGVVAGAGTFGQKSEMNE